MSELEGAVKPWILRIAGSADLSTLQDSARRLVFSRWALKTACVIDHLSGIHEIAPQIPKRLAECRHELPANIYVFVGWQDYEHRALFSLNQRNSWSTYPRDDKSIDVARLAEGQWFKVAFAIERLMVLVAGMPSPDHQLVIGTGVHVPIWPTTKIDLHHWYYSMRLEGLSPPNALQMFSDLLAVARAGRV